MFLSLLLDPAEYFEITVENPEINILEKRGDYIWKLSDGRQEAFFTFEFQLRPSQEALRSAYVKCALLHETCGLPVIGVILYLTKNSYQEEYEVSFHGCKNRYVFETIKLWEYREDVESGKRKELAPFLVLMSDHPDEQVLRREKELIMQVEDEKKRANLLSIALTMALRYFQEDWVRAYFKEEMTMIKTADIFDEILGERIQKGIQQGAREAAQESVIEILQTRFDLISGGLVKLIRQVEDITILHGLIRKAVVVESPEKFEEIVKTSLPRQYP